jgi:hypothetical protein
MATKKKKKAAAPSQSIATEQMFKANEAAAASAISGGDASPETLASIGPVNLVQLTLAATTLPPAFIPVRTVVDITGDAVAVDINGRDESGKVVKELPEGETGSFFAGITADIGLQQSVIENAPRLAKEIELGNLGSGIGPTGMVNLPTTSIDVIKAGLRDLGLKGNIIDSGASFIYSLLGDGIVYENAIDVFLENKEYTFKDGRKVESPFYKEYGYLNEVAPEKKSAGELFGFVTGMENIVKKYNISPKFASREKLLEATKNSVNVKDLDIRANIARLKAITADPIRIDALRNLGYIKNGEDLTDFYLDTSIGIEEFENRRRTSYLTTEALRRASAGITIDTARMKQLAATLGAQGYTAEGVEKVGAEAYETIAQQLPELTKLSGIFEQGRAAKPQDIQQELESEQLLGMASQRRKRLEQANINIFSGESGRARTRTSSAGMI